MIRGTTLFICTQCKKVYLAPDVEYRAMAHSVSIPCERCGSMHTMPLRLSIFSKSDELNPSKPLEEQLWDYSIYKSIWERMGLNGCVEQVDTPDEQYRIGMSYLDGTSWSYHSSDVAFYWLMKAAKQGHVQAQYQVGVLLRGRKPVPRYLQNPPFCYSEGTAYQWIRKAAEQGLPEALCYLGNHRAEDLEKAVTWYQKAIVSGCYAASEYAIACMYERCEEMERHTFRPLRWCWKAALHGYADAQLRLGTIYENAGKERHLHTAFAFYQQAASQRPAEAWQRLASLYEAGKGVEQDLVKAWECYQKAWEAGSEQAYKKAKCLLDEGRANPEMSAVKEWYRKCIAKGQKEMWYDLGKLYQECKEGEQDLKEAFQCYLIAARTAHVAEAQYAVGCMYELGEGTQPDLHEAVRWYKEAAKQGHVQAQAACRRLEEQEEQFLKGQ